RPVRAARLREGRTGEVRPPAHRPRAHDLLARADPARRRRGREEHARPRPDGDDPRRARMRELPAQLPRRAGPRVHEARRLPPELRQRRARAPGPRGAYARARLEPQRADPDAFDLRPGQVTPLPAIERLSTLPFGPRGLYESVCERV